MWTNPSFKALFVAQKLGDPQLPFQLSQPALRASLTLFSFDDLLRCRCPRSACFAATQHKARGFARSCPQKLVRPRKASAACPRARTRRGQGKKRSRIKKNMAAHSIRIATRWHSTTGHDELRRDVTNEQAEVAAKKGTMQGRLHAIQMRKYCNDWINTST